MEQNNKQLLTRPLIVTALAIFCCALWGSATPAIKIGKEMMVPAAYDSVGSTILFAGVRFTLAGIFTVLIFSIAGRKFLYPRLSNMPRVLTVSAFQTVIQYIFFYIGLTNTTGVKGTVASGSGAFFALLIAALLFRQEKLTPRKLIACTLGFAGIIVVNLNNGLDFTMNLTGDGFVIFSAISYAVSSVLIKRFSKYENPVVISGYQFIIGGAVMILLGFSLGGRMVISSPPAALLMVYLALLSAAAYSIWGLLLQHNPVSRVTVFNFTTPVFGVLLSAIFLTGERDKLSWFLLPSLLLVSAGILLLNYKKAKKD